MGRLIDTGEMLVNETEAYMKAQLQCDSLTRKINEVVHKKIQMLLADTPTAYDVEKVVAELVEMRNKDSQGCKDVGKKCLSYTDCGLCIMDRAIDIVKRGGVE